MFILTKFLHLNQFRRLLMFFVLGYIYCYTFNYLLTKQIVERFAEIGEQYKTIKKAHRKTNY